MARSETPEGGRDGRRGQWTRTGPHEHPPPEHRAEPHWARPQRTDPLNADNAPDPEPDRYAPRRRYPWHDDPDYDPTAHRRTPPPPAPWPQPPVPKSRPVPEPGAVATGEAADVPWTGERPAGPTRVPRKLTVTRVAMLRSRELTGKGIAAFRRAAHADGADRSGLTALTYSTMLTYAVDAAVAVALANTLFFAAATAESITNVSLYLAITVAPFAVVAPVIGPLLDRVQRGRRAALALSFAGRGILAVVLALNYDTWLLYPCALGMLVLSKSYVVLKAAVTPRVLPDTITLVTVNSRLTTFGLVAGGVFGAVAAGVAVIWDSPGALFFTAALAVVGTVQCLRIPRWVESTAGEVPAALRSTTRGRRKRPMMSHAVAVSLWGNGAIKILTGFLTLFVAFVVKGASEAQAAAAGAPAPDATQQLLQIGIIGGAAGIGQFIGNGIGSRRLVTRTDGVILTCIGAAVAVAVLAAVIPGIATAAVVGLIGSIASALAKVCVDAAIQRDLPEESRASAFGRSETVLQLAWVFGGVLGVLMPHDNYTVGFAVVAVAVAVVGVQTALVTRNRSMLPRRRRPAPAVS